MENINNPKTKNSNLRNNKLFKDKLIIKFSRNYKNKKMQN